MAETTVTVDGAEDEGGAVFAAGVATATSTQAAEAAAEAAEAAEGAGATAEAAAGLAAGAAGDAWDAKQGVAELRAETHGMLAEIREMIAGMGERDQLTDVAPAPEPTTPPAESKPAESKPAESKPAGRKYGHRGWFG